MAGEPKVVLMTLKKDQFESLLGPLQELIAREMRRREESTAAQRIKWEDLEVMTLLGEGSFGRVKICRHTSNTRMGQPR